MEEKAEKRILNNDISVAALRRRKLLRLFHTVRSADAYFLGEGLAADVE